MIYVTTIEKLNETIHLSDGVVCMGAGRYAARLDQVLDQPACRKILNFVDSDKGKHYTNYVIKGKAFPIYPVISLKECLNKNIVVIITTWQVEAMEYQLEMLGVSDLTVFSLEHIIEYDAHQEAMKKTIPQNIKLYQMPVIPKVIHYCWFGKQPVPDKYYQWMESWSKYCPDYEIKQWNEENYDITKNRYMLQAYQEKKWGFVPDYARLDIVYEHGGIYLDTDVELVKSFDDLLYQKGFAGFESKRFVAFGLGFGAVKALPILKKMRDAYDDMEFRNEDGTLNLVASPRFQTDILIKDGLKLNGEYQIIDELTIFPEKMFCGKNERTRQIELTSYTHSIHHYDASWCDTKNKYIRAGWTHYFGNIYQQKIQQDTKKRIEKIPQLTVVVPVYNCEKYLKMCVDSILQQHYENLEIILVNDGSTDNSKQICDSYIQKDQRVKVLHKENGGLVSARAAGVKAAASDYVTFVDADDWIYENTYAPLMESLVHTGADVITYGCIRYWDDIDYKIDVDESIEAGYYDKRAMENDIIPRMLFYEKTNGWALDPSLCMKIFKKKNLVNEYRKMENKKFYYGEDTAVIYPLLLNCESIIITHQAHYYHRQRPRYVRSPYFRADGFYDDLYQVYSYLKQEFKQLPHWDLMEMQLDYFYMNNVGRKMYEYQILLNKPKAFMDAAHSFLFPFDVVKKGKRIALYGAGKVGHNFKRQLDMTKYCEIVYWIDKNYREESVISPEQFISKSDYDQVVIALASDVTRMEIKKWLIKQGVAAEKIIDYPTYRL